MGMIAGALVDPAAKLINLALQEVDPCGEDENDAERDVQINVHG